MPTTSEPASVYVVEDDASMRDSLSLMLSLLGYRSAVFASAEAFLDACREDWTGCLVADLRLPGKDGLQLQAELQGRGMALPFVIITAHGDVASARAAFQSDAVDFLEKPFEAADLCAAIEKGLKKGAGRAGSERQRHLTLGRLTAREREVLDLVGQGLHVKEVARALGISPRTVEVHKTHLMEKLGARNVAELVRFAIGVAPPA